MSPGSGEYLDRLVTDNSSVLTNWKIWMRRLAKRWAGILRLGMVVVSAANMSF